MRSTTLWPLLIGASACAQPAQSPAPEASPGPVATTSAPSASAERASASAAAPPPIPMAMASASASAAPRAKADPPSQAVLDGLPVRPCEVAATHTPGGAPGGVTLRRVQPDGFPLDVGFADDPPEVFTYDASGRVTRGQRGTYTYGRAGQVTVTRSGHVTRLRVDAKGRVAEHNGARHTYDAKGRLTRVAHASGRFVAYTYAADGTYKTSHNYPDRDEFCEADLVEVKRDGRGRISLDRFDGCGINETPHSLHYHYDESDRLIRVDVDLNSDGSIDGVVTLRPC